VLPFATVAAAGNGYIAHRFGILSLKRVSMRAFADTAAKHAGDEGSYSLHKSDFRCVE
jgi:hypothetical protein